MNSITNRMIALLITGAMSVAVAQAQSPIAPPQGGIAVVSGGWYAAGTTFANGMAYPPGANVPDGNMILQTSYDMPMYRIDNWSRTSTMPSRGYNNNSSSRSMWTQYPNFSTFNDRYRFNDPGFTMDPGFSSYSGFGNMNRGWSGYSGSRGSYGGRRR